MTQDPDTAARGGMRAKARIAAMALLLLALPAWIALAVYSSPFVRGSDQYWYVEDVRTILAGGHGSHEAYPFSLVGADRRFDAGRPFIHDVPVLYVWAAASKAVNGNAHRGIQLVNILCALGAAVFTFLAARRFTGRLGALAAGVAVLYVPVVFAIASQDLAEVFSALGVAIGLWLVARWPDDVRAASLAGVAAAVAAAGRLWVLPLVVLLPAGLVFAGASLPLRRRLARAALAAVPGIVLYAVLSRVFVSYMPQLDLLQTVEIARHGGSNMVLYYRTGAAGPFDPGAFLRGLARNAWIALRAQASLVAGPFTASRSVPAADFMPANVALVLAVFGLCARGVDRTRRWFLALAVLAFGMHLGMAVLYQDQPRYLVPLAPVMVLGAVIALERAWTALSGRAARAGLVVLLSAVLVAFAAVDAGTAIVNRASARLANARLGAVSALVSATVPPDAVVALDTAFSGRWAADAAIYPRTELALATDPGFGFTPAARDAALAKMRPGFLVTDATSGLPASIGAERLGSAAGYTVWRMPQR